MLRYLCEVYQNRDYKRFRWDLLLLGPRQLQCNLYKRPSLFDNSRLPSQIVLSFLTPVKCSRVEQDRVTTRFCVCPK